MKLKEIKDLSNDELMQKEKALKKELFDLNYHRRMGTVEKPARFRQIKRAIARILTVIRERELENERNKKRK